MFKILVEKEVGKPLKSLRIDRGGEYTSIVFDDFCNENGIRRQLTNVYTPQQNGVAKRKTRTVMNMARALFSAKKIPKSFLKDVTPHEAWSGVKPHLEHFKVSGCIAHAHVPKVNREWGDKTQNEGGDDNMGSEDKLEGGNEAVENAEEDNEEEPQVQEEESDNEEEPQVQEEESQVLGRLRRPPTWMNDFVSGDTFSDDDNINMVQNMGPEDPTHFQDAVKNEGKQWIVMQRAWLG
ncbi:uncharacterized protein LOC124939011 [Impatiens glandulifera]|uniref:uncharacterized protein LOC124939011 n=1 Tax=Impatiens glandulifera TaxID=253017 RepID=UPI001FB1964A|nr:uncharacterized protein LOC124939011 [Impatiens glandulifera]